MSPLSAFAIIAATSAVAVAAMLFLRRFAPRGGFFSDSDRAAGITRQLFRTAMLFAPADRDALHGELVCYGRAVVFDEWRTMREGRESSVVQGWLDDIDRTIERVDVRGPKQEVAYGHWFDRAASRQEGRRGRLAEAAPFVPPVVWLVLILAGSLLITYTCFYADRAERAAIQALSMTGVVTMVVSGLLLVRFLDRPYEDSSGSVTPAAMAGTVASIERRAQGAFPCDARGAPRT